jgi:hypothetical protein
VRNPLGVHPERVEEAPQHVGRIGRLTGPGVEPPQVGVELPVRELIRDLVRPLKRQRRLPHPGRPPDGGDDDAGTDGRPAAEHGVKRRQLRPPPGEVRDPRWQLPRHGGLPYAGRGAVGDAAIGSADVDRAGSRPAAARLLRPLLDGGIAAGDAPGPVPGDQLRPRRFRQPERPRQRPHRARVRPPRPAALQIGDGPHGDPGPFRQILLGQPGPNALIPQPLARPHPAGDAECARGRTIHDPTTCP